MVPAKRYAPFAAVILAQLLLVGIAPSKGREVAGPQFAGQQAYQDPSLGAGAGGAAAPGTAGGRPRAGGSAGAVPGASGGGNAAGTAGAGGATGGTSGATSPGGSAGDRSRCAGARQFADFPQAPPCVPHTGTNPGATYKGVTAKTIKLVYFREKDNPVVKGLLQSQGIYSNPEDQKRFMAAMEKFINLRYELYGRRVEISFWASPCEAAPPVDSCFRDDAKAMVAKEKPFAVVYDNNTNAPAFFDELSKLRVVNFGGWHFQDSFSTARRPYHWDAFMGGDFQAKLTGEYWCKRLAGKKARYAGSADLKALTRKAAVFYPKTEVNVEPAKHLQSILKGCGTQVVDVPYSPDTATASSQASSQVAQAKAAGATSVLYFADPIAPAFGTSAMTSQRWFPEHVLVGSGLIDYDALARLYDKQQWAHAFGVSDTIVYPPLSKQESAITWRAAGNSGTPYSSAQLPWSYWSVVTCGLQMAGPTLDPGSFEAAMLGGRCDTPTFRQTRNPGLSHVHFGQGDYTAGSDAKEVYWDPDAKSVIDGKQGAYVALLRGRRYRIGEWSTTEPVLPGR